MHTIKRILKGLLKIGIIGVLVIILFELSYRFSVIDFYKPELEVLNTKHAIASHDIDYLVFGDSFSAAQDNYIDFLSNSSNKIFLNSSVIGIGIKQVNTFANRRLNRYNPKNIIYQVYIGNDLTDVNHLTNYKTLSIARNLYWELSDVILSSSYINYRLGYLKSSNKKAETITFNTPFSVKYYNQRSKIYFKSDGSYLYKTVTVTEDFEKRYSIWIEELKEFIESIPKNTKMHILFIPHCAQVNSFYRDNISKIGGVFTNEDKFAKIQYSFFEKASSDLKNYKNVTLLNPLKRFREVDSINHRLYYLNDPHLNKLGQEVLGKYIKEQLQLIKK